MNIEMNTYTVIIAVVLIAGLIIVLISAFKKGSGFRIKKSEGDVTIEASEKKNKVEILNESELDDVSIEEIKGVTKNKDSSTDDVDILNKGKIKKGEIGKITGLEIKKK